MIRTLKSSYCDNKYEPGNFGESFPLPIFGVSPFSVISDQDQMYLGDEYEVYGEGDWRGMATAPLERERRGDLYNYI